MLGNDSHNWASIPERHPLTESTMRRAALSKLDRRAPLTIIRAPNGYGKSSLVASWLRTNLTTERNIVWVSAPHPNMPVDEYWSTVLDRLHQCGIIGERTVDETQEDLYHSIVRTIEASPRPILLVLVRPDLVTASTLDDSLGDILRRCHHLDLVVTLSGTDMFPEPYLLDIDHEVVTGDELLLTTTEIVDLLARSTVLTSPGDAARIASLTNGLPVLVRAAVAAIGSAPTGSSREQNIDAKVTRAVDRYVADDVLDSADTLDQREFFLAVACAHPLTVDIAELLFGTEESDQQIRTRLTTLETAGLIARLDTADEECWNLPPPLRHSIIRQLPGSGIDPSQQLSFLAHTMLEYGRPVPALDYAVEARNWTLAVDIIEEHWTAMISDGIPAICAALQQIPPDAAAKHPAVQAGRALFGTPTTDCPGPFRSLPASAEELHTLGVSAEAKEALGIGCVQSIMLRQAGEYARSAEITRRLSHLSRSAVEHNPDDISPMLPLMRLQWGINYQLHGNLTESSIEVRLAYEGGRSQRIDVIARHAAGSAAMNWAVAGEPSRARQWSDIEQRYPKSDGWLEPQLRAAGLVARTLAALDTLDVDRARESLDELGPPSDTDELWAFVTFAHCQAALTRGDVFPALTLLRRTINAHAQHHASGSFAQALMVATEIDLRVALGEGNRAMRLAQTVPDPTANPWTLVSIARLRHKTGDNDASIAMCHQFDWSSESYPRLHMEALLIQAVSYAEQGHPTLATRAWVKACTIADQTGLLRPFTTVSAAAITTLNDMAGTTSAAFTRFLRSRLAEIFRTPINLVKLTAREQELLAQLITGKKPTDIAHSLYVSVNTIKSQLRSLYKKLDAHNRTEAIAQAHVLGILDN